MPRHTEQVIAPKRLELAFYLRCVFPPLGELRRSTFALEINTSKL